MSPFTRLLVSIVLICVIQCRTSVAQAPAPGTATTDQLDLNERVFIASKVYASIPAYFAHWPGTPDFDLDRDYRRYLGIALAAKGRADFDLATKAFVAQLHNGHSGFSDSWLAMTQGQSPGFDARYVEGRWVVTQSRITGLKPGLIIRAIDGAPLEELYQKKKVYISASSDRSARAGFFSGGYLFPRRFTLTTEDGRRFAVERPLHEAAAPPEATEGRWIQKGSVAYIKVPGFDDPKCESAAISYVRQFESARALIIDVRGNGGGNTPTGLVDGLMDRPYRFWTGATPLNVGLFAERAGELGEMQRSPGRTPDPEQKGYLEAFGDLAVHPMLSLPAAAITPQETLFRGRLLLLTDGDCYSACEDFLVPFKDNKRATLVGETTGGSTGQPFHYDFGNGMAFRLSTIRESMPDGSPFEGVGITPDVDVPRTIADITAGRDAVLDKALALCGVADTGGK